jgi:predicted phosphoadenosine phosphosulfate sulfurtransferase
VKFYIKDNVWEAALKRMRWLFDEFPNVLVGFSGGKDSTIILNLALLVAREKGRLPLKVMFVDQEAEWQATVNYVRLVMENPEVEPLWYQIPIQMVNATSQIDTQLYCWEPGKEDVWLRPKEPNAIKENTYGTNRFFELFEAILTKDFAGLKTCYLAGVRCEESPSRFQGLTMHETYKGATWGKCFNKKAQLHFTMYPIYDWALGDVWKAINDNGWPYNELYDHYYRYGVPPSKMRVSNVHHETAVKSLFHLQEIEPETYQRLTQRIQGIDMAGKMNKDDYFIHDLPHMFKDWREYRDYLLENLIANPEWRDGFAKKFKWMEEIWLDKAGDKLFRLHINSILTNDYEHVKLANWCCSIENALHLQLKQGKVELRK